METSIAERFGRVLEKAQRRSVSTDRYLTIAIAPLNIFSLCRTDQGNSWHAVERIILLYLADHFPPIKPKQAQIHQNHEG